MQDPSPDAAVDQADVHQPSAVVRHLGLIKALAIIMAVLIVAALVVIVVTIYSRLQPVPPIARQARSISFCQPVRM